VNCGFLDCEATSEIDETKPAATLMSVNSKALRLMMCEIAAVSEANPAGKAGADTARWLWDRDGRRDCADEGGGKPVIRPER